MPLGPTTEGARGSPSVWSGKYLSRDETESLGHVPPGGSRMLTCTCDESTNKSLHSKAQTTLYFCLGKFWVQLLLFGIYSCGLCISIRWYNLGDGQSRPGQHYDRGVLLNEPVE